MTIGERIQYVRKELKMTQSAFGDSLGVTRDVINNLEHDRNKGNSESLLRLLCKTHNVNYFYLTEGIGEPFVDVPDIIFDEAVEKYSLDSLDKLIIEEYVKLKPEVRSALKTYLKTIFEKEAPD